LSITLDWFNTTHTILLATFAGKWTLDDYHLMIDEGASRINAENHTVHVIYDLTQTNTTPAHLMSAARYAEKRLPENQGIVIFVGANVIIKAFLRMAHQMKLKAARYTYTVDTLEDALIFIEEKEEKEEKNRDHIQRD